MSQQGNAGLGAPRFAVVAGDPFGAGPEGAIPLPGPKAISSVLFIERLFSGALLVSYPPDSAVGVGQTEAGAVARTTCWFNASCRPP